MLPPPDGTSIRSCLFWCLSINDHCFLWEQTARGQTPLEREETPFKEYGTVSGSTPPRGERTFAVSARAQRETTVEMQGACQTTSTTIRTKPWQPCRPSILRSSNVNVGNHLLRRSSLSNASMLRRISGLLLHATHWSRPCNAAASERVCMECIASMRRAQSVATLDHQIFVSYTFGAHPAPHPSLLEGMARFHWGSSECFATRRARSTRNEGGNDVYSIPEALPTSYLAAADLPQP